MHDYAIEMNYTHHFAHEDGEYHVLESAVYNSELKEGLYKVAVGQSKHIIINIVQNSKYSSFQIDAVHSERYLMVMFLLCHDKFHLFQKG